MTYRMGYGLGIIGSGLILRYKMNISKEHYLCICLVVISGATVLQSVCQNFGLMLFATLLSGLAMGGFEVYCNVLFTECWGKRVQPWFQTLFALLGLGAVVGPALVGIYNVTVAFQFLAELCIVPFVILLSKPYLLKLCYENSVEQEFELVSTTLSPMKPVLTSVEQMDRPSSLSSSTLITSVDSPLRPSHDIELSMPRNINSSSDVIENRQRMVTPDEHSDELEEEEVGAHYKIPWIANISLFLYYMGYMGAEVSFSGWIATYVIDLRIIDSPNSATFLVSVFYGALMLSRISTAIVAVWVPNMYMIRGLLCIAIVFSCITIGICGISYESAYAATFISGFALGPIFGLGFNIPTDYHCKLTETTTTIAILGGSAGEMVFPVLVGVFLHADGVKWFPLIYLFIIIYICIHYYCLHVLFTNNLKSNTDKHMQVLTMETVESPMKNGQHGNLEI